MFNPLSRLIALGADVLRATPILIPIYFALLAGLHALPVRNPHANLERLALLQQQLAFFATLDGYFIWSLARDVIRKKVKIY